MSYSITTEDGITIDNIPDNVDPNSPELKARVAALRSTGVDKPTKKEESVVERISQSAAEAAKQIPRQLGLTARAGVTGAAGLPLMAGDALNQLINMFGGNLPMASKSMQTLLTSAGLPEPITKEEKIAQDVASAGFGVAAPAAIAQRSMQTAQTAGVESPALARFFAENVPLQAAAAGGGALASAAGREYADVGGMGQAGLAMLGGMVAPSGMAGGAQVLSRAGKEVVRPFTASGREAIVGKVLEQLANRPQGLAQRLEEFQAPIGGYTPTTAQASRDVGLISAETAIRGMDTTGQFAAQASQANKARMTILDRMAKDQDAVTQAIAKRDEVTAPMREAAFAASTQTPEQIQSATALIVNKQIDDILASPAGKRSTVINAMNFAKNSVNRADSVESLYEVRKDLRAAAQGLLDKEGSAYSQAKGQLENVIRSVDDVIDASAPGYKDYLRKYSQASKGIERMGEAQTFRSKVLSTTPDPINVGDFMISQPSFARAIRATAKDTQLSEMQVRVLEKVGRDLDSGVLNRSGKVPGSDTFKNLSTANVIGGIIGKQMFGEVPPIVNKTIAPLNWLYNGTDDQIRELLVQSMLDPKLASRLLTKASTTTVEPLSKELQKKALSIGYGAAFGLSE
jgi:hypothetical protein